MQDDLIAREGWEPQVGDRVVLINRDGWSQQFHSFAEKRRPATVRSIHKFELLIAFDVLRGNAYPRYLRVRPADVEPLRARAVMGGGDD